MAQCIHRLIALQSKKVSKNYIWIAITAPFPVLGHSNNVWDISGQVLGHETFFFWDISGHQQNKNPLNPVRNPLPRALDRSKPTNWTRYVRVTYSHFRTFWDILGKCEIWWEKKISASSSSFFSDIFLVSISLPKLLYSFRKMLFAARLWECSQPDRTTRCFWGNCSLVRRISANLSTPDEVSQLWR